MCHDQRPRVGCKACQSACKTANQLPLEDNIGERLWDSPLDLSGYTYTVIKLYAHGTMEHKDQAENGFAHLKRQCLHCVDPSCVSACPVQAMRKDPQVGVVSYDADACIGCRYCVAACPFGVPQFQYDTPVPQIAKCQLCRLRMVEGKYAACAEHLARGYSWQASTESANHRAAEDRRKAGGGKGYGSTRREGGTEEHDSTGASANRACAGQSRTGFADTDPPRF